jgi:hypothetical protein
VSDHVPFLSDEWPETTPGSGKYIPIKISPAEKSLIGESVKSFSPIQTSPNKPIPQMRPKNFQSEEKLSLYFGKMIQSLGCFFNPNRFCDVLFTASHSGIQEEVARCNQETLKSLHATLQGDDLNKLVSLLKMIKEGNAETRKEVYQWLSVKNPGILDEKFHALAEKLYDSTNTFMQSVRQNLGNVPDYAYNNLELKPSRVYTNKNAACMKRLLEIYVEATPKKDFTYSLLDNFYYFIYPGEKLKEAYEFSRELSFNNMVDSLVRVIPEEIDESTSIMIETV